MKIELEAYIMDEIIVSPSLSELKPIEVGEGKVKKIKYADAFIKEKNPCSLIITNNFCHAINFQRDAYSRLLSISREYLAYIVFSRATTSTVVKILHIASKNYSVLKTFTGSVQSILFNDGPNCMLGIIDNFATFYIYTVNYADNRIIVECICTLPTVINASYQLSTTLTFNFTWTVCNCPNDSDDKISILLWRNDGVCRVVNLKNENITPANFSISSEINFNIASIVQVNITMGLYIKDSQAIILSFSDGSIRIYSIENQSAVEKDSMCVFENISINTFNIINNSTENSSLESYSLIACSRSDIKLLSLKPFEIYQSLSFDPTCKLLPGVSYAVCSLYLIDAQHKILLNLKLKSDNKTKISEITAFPLSTETIAFGHQPSANKDDSEFVLCEYHRTGLRCLNVLKKVENCQIINDNIETEDKGFTWISAICNTKKNSTNLMESNENVSYSTPASLNVSAISIPESESHISALNCNLKLSEKIAKKELNDQDETASLPENFISHLLSTWESHKKDTEASYNRFSDLLVSQIDKRFQETKTHISDISNTISGKLEVLEKRLKSIEESRKKTSTAEDNTSECSKHAYPYSYGFGPSSANSGSANPYAFPITAKSKAVDTNAVNEKLVTKSIQTFLSSKDFINCLVPNLREGIKTALAEHINSSIGSLVLPKIEKELRFAFDAVNQTFNTGTKQYLNSLESHLSKVAKTSEEGLTNPSSLKLHFENTIRSSQEQISSLLTSKVNILSSELIQKLDAILPSNLEAKLISAIKTELCSSSSHQCKTKQMLQNEIKLLISTEELTKAFSLSVQSKDKETILIFLEQVSAVTLFDSNNPAPVSSTLLLEFLKLISVEMIKMNAQKCFEYLQETLLALQSPDRVIQQSDLRKTMVETKLRLSSLKNQLDKALQKSLIILMSLCQTSINSA